MKIINNLTKIQNHNYLTYHTYFVITLPKAKRTAQKILFYRFQMLLRFPIFTTAFQYPDFKILISSLNVFTSHSPRRSGTCFDNC